MKGQSWRSMAQRNEVFRGGRKSQRIQLEFQRESVGIDTSYTVRNLEETIM
jgi:hypothetical protein